MHFILPPLPLYGCKAHKHWAQAEGGALLTTPSPYTQPLPHRLLHFGVEGVNYKVYYFTLRLKVGPSLRTPSPCPTDQEFAHAVTPKAYMTRDSPL